MKTMARFLVVLFSFTVSFFVLNDTLVQAGPGGGTYYANSPAGWGTGTAIRKFVDSMPGLGPDNANNLGYYIPVANPDQSTYPGDDYYVLGLSDYTEKMHTDLPKATLLRGYYQINAGNKPGFVTDNSKQYLGPLIIANKDRPVRIKFENRLGVGALGNLFIPVDTTIAGAGKGPLKSDGTPCDPDSLPTNCVSFTQNRAAIHMHGGVPPWYSDGTPHQWTVPVGDTTTPYSKGLSVRDVPDMPATGLGELTFYYPNHQSSRLMFYHDHAYGITRLNVYAGEAAGYLLTDEAEEDFISGTNVSGFNPTSAKLLPDLGGIYHYGVPLIIQDKTFVPENISIQDALWPGRGWGTYGDLWFPHVYEPNQDPNQEGGMSPYGRWDYGPWFWPIVQFPTLKGPLPEPSIVPEAFMDTSVVNGTAYPYLDVEQKRYRFRILNACNDRTLNLQLYYAEPLSVAVISGGSGYSATPTITFFGGGASTPAIATATVVGGEITGITVSNPGVGYTSVPEVIISDPDGIGASAVASLYTEVKMVPAYDNRVGGVPDDTMAGPPFTVIATEGGFMPQPYVTNDPSIKPLYITYDKDPRSITINNISNTNLLLGSAQRSDIIVDFGSVPVGSKLILYNDAPAPAPANDKRVDYFTSNPDSTANGGAPSTLPGYGPNTRTIMQFRVIPNSGPPDPPAPTLQELTTALTAAFHDPTEPSFIVPLGNYANNFSIDIPADSQGNIFPILMKTIQELFELEYGRMNTMLGTELQNTDFTIQTTQQMYYPDLPTEIIPQDQPQVWMIIHNGVDTHFVHFHLFNVQVVNRVDWAGVVKPPYEDESGWRDTIRADPLEQVIVAVQPLYPVIPAAWPAITDSERPLDVTKPDSSGGLVVPATTFNATTNPNPVLNFGHEYVWHCHLLGHEENDMMRALVMEVPTAAPAAPTLTAVTAVAGGLQLTWTNNADFETDPTIWPNDASGFYVERCDGAAPCATSFTQIATVYDYHKVPDVYLMKNPPFVPDTTVTYTNLVASGSTYNYRISAFNAAGTSATSSNLGEIANTWSTAASVTLTPSGPSPHTAGIAALFTATPTPTVVGLIEPPYEYRFYLDGGVTPVQDWSTNNQWSMPATTPVGVHSVRVDVTTNPVTKSVDTNSTMSYEIIPAAATGVLLTANKVSPQLYGTPVAFTATGQGSAGYEYRFWFDGVAVRDYSTVATWNMPTDTALGAHEVVVDVRTDTNILTPDATSSILSFSIGNGVTFIAGANGTISGNLSQAVAPGGSTSAVTAVPATGYHLVNWTGDNLFVTTTDNPLTVNNVTAGHNITAHFAIDTFTVTFAAAANGTVTGTLSQTLNYGDTASVVTAVPNNLYHFVRWTGTGGFPTTVSNPLTLTNVTANMDITANFDVGTTMVPDGDLGNGCTIDDAQTALLLAAGAVPTTPGDLAHGDVAPLVGGRPQPDGKIDIGDVEVILRKALGIITW